jgi:hypothetical protein
VSNGLPEAVGAQAQESVTGNVPQASTAQPSSIANVPSASNAQASTIVSLPNDLSTQQSMPNVQVNIKNKLPLLPILTDLLK